MDWSQCLYRVKKMKMFLFILKLRNAAQCTLISPQKDILAQVFSNIFNIKKEDINPSKVNFILKDFLDRQTSSRVQFLYRWEQDKYWNFFCGGKRALIFCWCYIQSYYDYPGESRLLSQVCSNYVADSRSVLEEMCAISKEDIKRKWLNVVDNKLRAIYASSEYYPS